MSIGELLLLMAFVVASLWLCGNGLREETAAQNRRRLRGYPGWPR